MVQHLAVGWIVVGLLTLTTGCASMHITTGPQESETDSRLMGIGETSQLPEGNELALHAGGLEPRSHGHAAYLISTTMPDRVEYRRSSTVRLERSFLEELQNSMRSESVKEMLGIWFCTRDEGKTWFPSAPPRLEKTQAVFSLQKDGRYGFRYVSIAEGPVEGMITPEAGVRPQFLVVVDTRAPRIRWIERADKVSNSGKFLLCWEAQDENLDDHPVRIEYRLRPSEAWRPLGDKFSPSGVLEWEPPQADGQSDVQEYRFRLLVEDLAGLSSCDEISLPVPQIKNSGFGRTVSESKPLSD